MEQLATGATVYLIAKASLPRLLTRKDSVGTIHNALIVDDKQSCKRCGTVVLRKGLVRERDYLVLDEASWREISKQVNVDWEIARKVVRVRDSPYLACSLYPPMIKLCFWNRANARPRYIRCQTHKLSVPAPRLSSVASIGDVADQLWFALGRADALLFPDLKPKGMELWCFRQEEPERRAEDREVGWVPLETVAQWAEIRPMMVCFVEPWRKKLATGAALDAQDTLSVWYKARVVDARTTRVFIHYCGWGPEWDEWLPRDSPRLAPTNMKTGSLRKVTSGMPVRLGALASAPPGSGKRKKASSATTWQHGEVVAVLDVRMDGENGIERWACVEFDGRQEWRSAVNDEFLQASGAIAAPRIADKKRKR